MNSDFIAAVHPLLREVALGPAGTCATIELSSDSRRWVQLMDQTINAAYPFDIDPETRLPALLKRPVIIDVSSFLPGSFLTLAVKDISDRAVVEWVEDYFVDVLGCEHGELAIDTRIEHL